MRCSEVCFFAFVSKQVLVLEFKDTFPGVLKLSKLFKLGMELTPIRGFFAFIGLVSLIVYAAGGCRHVVGAMNAFAGEYNDVYTGMNDDNDEKEEHPKKK